MNGYSEADMRCAGPGKWLCLSASLLPNAVAPQARRIFLSPARGTSIPFALSEAVVARVCDQLNGSIILRRNETGLHMASLFAGLLLTITISVAARVRALSPVPRRAIHADPRENVRASR